MKIYIISILLIISSIPAKAQNYGSWISFDTLNTARNVHSAVLLSNDDILVAGGEDDKGNILSSCEIFDFNEKKWRTTSSLNYPRYKLVLVQLLDNRILAVGGEGITSCEIFDPVTETWSMTDSLYTKRYTYNINTVLLDDGRVLVTGGFDIKADINNRYLNICEIFDPFNNTWSLTDSLRIARAGHTITKLKDGRVLVAGGTNREDLYINKCEIFDPDTDTWTTADSLNFARSNHSSILLSNGNIMIAAGKGLTEDPTNTWLSSCELYDLDNDEWKVVGSLSVSRTEAKAFLVSDNLIMFADGIHNAHLWELYDINEFKTVNLDYFPVDKLKQEIVIQSDNTLISIGGVEVYMNNGDPYVFASYKCEIYKLGVTSIDEKNQLINEFKLNQNYPNPFNPNTTITYQLTTRNHVTLKVYDILSKEVITLVNEEQNAGEYKIEFSAKGRSASSGDVYNLVSGVYFYRLQAGEFSETRKMILLR